MIPPFFMATEKEYQALLNVYQNKVSELTSQNIALEARILVLSSQINNIQQSQMQSVQVEESTKSGRKVNTKKSDLDSGEF